MDIDWYLRDESSDERALIIQLAHEYIMSIIPNCRVQRKYGLPFYVYRKDLCYMHFLRDRPYISFMQGRFMQDTPMLEKGGKNLFGRYYILKEEDIYATSFTEFLIEAIDIQDRLFKK